MKYTDKNQNTIKSKMITITFNVGLESCRNKLKTCLTNSFNHPELMCIFIFIYKSFSLQRYK